MKGKRRLETPKAEAYVPKLPAIDGTRMSKGCRFEIEGWVDFLEQLLPWIAFTMTQAVLTAQKDILPLVGERRPKSKEKNRDTKEKHGGKDQKGDPRKEKNKSDGKDGKQCLCFCVVAVFLEPFCLCVAGSERFSSECFARVFAMLLFRASMDDILCSC